MEEESLIGEGLLLLLNVCSFVDIGRRNRTRHKRCVISIDQRRLIITIIIIIIIITIRRRRRRTDIQDMSLIINHTAAKEIESIIDIKKPAISTIILLCVNRII
jgi:hypothetical protein